MKTLAILMMMIGLGGFACVAAAEEKAPQPLVPDYDYCAQRDADPAKCVIQDGPPHRHILRRKRAAVLPPPVSQTPGGNRVAG